MKCKLCAAPKISESNDETLSQGEVNEKYNQLSYYGNFFEDDKDSRPFLKFRFRPNNNRTSNDTIVSEPVLVKLQPSRRNETRVQIIRLLPKDKLQTKKDSKKPTYRIFRFLPNKDKNEEKDFRYFKTKEELHGLRSSPETIGTVRYFKSPNELYAKPKKPKRRKHSKRIQYFKSKNELYRADSVVGKKKKKNNYRPYFKNKDELYSTPKVSVGKKKKKRTTPLQYFKSWDEIYGRTTESIRKRSNTTVQYFKSPDELYGPPTKKAESQTERTEKRVKEGFRSKFVRFWTKINRINVFKKGKNTTKGYVIRMEAEVLPSSSKNAIKRQIARYSSKKKVTAYNLGGHVLRSFEVGNYSTMLKFIPENTKLARKINKIMTKQSDKKSHKHKSNKGKNKHKPNKGKNKHKYTNIKKSQYNFTVI